MKSRVKNICAAGLLLYASSSFAAPGDPAPGGDPQQLQQQQQQDRPMRRDRSDRPGGPGGGPGNFGGGPGGAERGAGDAKSFVARLMAFDKDADGKLTETELADARLHALFVRADADKDGSITQAELTAVYEKESADRPNVAGGPGDGGGPDGRFPGGPGAMRRGGGAPGGAESSPASVDSSTNGPGAGQGPGNGPGRGGPPRPGQVISPGLQDRLNLTPEQREKVDALQKTVDSKLAEILTPDQQRQLAESRPRGPGRGGPDGAGDRGPSTADQGDRNPQNASPDAPAGRRGNAPE